ncbi:DUF805 domain-containing protein [Sphingomonas sabuli]|uniref:DUF805 domain-containing protein n=1 Tax=Sphingomonas sabuli TaxID=2764186 RepID=A0A7G9L2S4_9SPHN|nr:DUF805 domain-containing protein [Sphingomonas sabuli]QNM82923.1 DUF805 domain-containing protein [Sphingomonas sabuli]
MFVFESAMATLRKYADFQGRASRHEFWCFFAFVILANAVAGLVGMLFGMGPMLSGLVGLFLVIPQIAVAVRRLHDVGKSGRELVVPCVILAVMPVAFAFRGILPQIVALGLLGVGLLAFANLLTLFLKKGTNVPNRYGKAPAAFSFAR